MPTGYTTASYKGDQTSVAVDGFDEMFALQLQQTKSPIWDAVTLDVKSGDKGYYDRIESSGEARTKTARGSSHTVDDTEYSRRMISWDTNYKSQFIDIEDIHRFMKDPTDKVVQNVLAAMARKRDLKVINTFFADIVGTGTDGATSTVSFPAGNTIAVDYTRAGGGSNSNLNPEKILKACEIMEDGFVGEDYGDMERKFIVMAPNQYFAMCTHADVKTIDSFSSKPIVDAMIRGVGGFTFIKSNMLLTDASDYRRVVAFTEKAIAKTTKGGLKLRLYEDEQRHFQSTIYAEEMNGVTRAWEERVVEILCDETAAA